VQRWNLVSAHKEGKEWAFWADSKSQRVWRTTRCNCCYTAHRTVENHYERHFGIDTGHEIMLHTFGVHDPDAVHYSPTPYEAFFKAMKLVQANLPTTTFVDYGSGLGRAIVCAATLPLRRVIGVEFVEELSSRAKLNIAAAQYRFACKDVSIVTANAMTRTVAPYVNIFHFYNPFLNDTLKGCIRQIAKSLRDHPREVWIVFGCPWQMSRLLAAGEIILSGSREQATHDRGSNAAQGRPHRLGHENSCARMPFIRPL